MNGQIDAMRLNGTSCCRAATVNRSTHGEMGRADWVDTLKMATSIILTLPTGLNTDVKASTVNGDIGSDFPVTVSGRISRRRVEGTIGGGGRLLALDSVNGSITLKRD